MKKGTIWTIGVIILLILAVVMINNGKKAPVSTGQTVPVAETGSIKIGVIAPLTGDGAVYGEPARQVYEIAVDEINKAGGINGKQIQLIVEDGKCNGESAVSAAQKLVNADGVQVIIGGFCSGESLAIIPVAEAKNVALISPSSSSPDLTSKSKIFFRNFPSDSSQGSVIAQVAYDLGKRKVAFFQEQTDYALGIYKSFNEKFTALGGVVVKEEAPSTAKDFRSQLSKLKAQKPDALFVDVQTIAVGDLIFKQAETLGLKTTILVNDVLIGNPEFITKYKNSLEGAIGAEFGVDSNNVKYKNLIETYKEKYGKDVPYPSYAQTEYDAVYILKDAISAVGYDGAKIADFGHKITNWQGASGSVTIGSDGDLVGGHHAEIIKDGKVMPYVK